MKTYAFCNEKEVQNSLELKDYGQHKQGFIKTHS